MLSKLLIDHQPGFMRNDGFSQLLSITYEIYIRFDCNAKSFVKGSFVDHSVCTHEAFDKARHKI